MINYPIQIKTPLEKLAALYSLEEQGRLEYNRVGDRASKDWGKNAGKWKKYRQLFNERYDQLLNERVKLREQILRDSGLNFEVVEPNNRISVMKTLWGDRHALRELPTEATSPLLDEIKALDFENLEKLAEEDPLVDWTTDGWAETDPNSKLTVSANEIAFAAVARGSGCHVGKDFGSGHFGSFIHKIDFNITAYTNSYDSQITVYDLFNDGTHWIDIFVQYSSSTVYNPQLLSMDPNYVSDYGNANKGTRYYGKLERNATNITFKYYTGSDYETGLVDTLAVSKGNSTPLSSIWNAGDSSGSGGSITGSLYNQDLQEADGTTVTPGTLALVITKYAPVLKLAVTPSTMALALATYAPTIISGTVVTPSTLALVLATFAPTISVTNNITVTPSTLPLSLTTYVPTVSIGGNQVLTPGTLDLVLTAYAPVLKLTVTPSTVALSLTSYAPVLKLTVTPSTLALTLTKYAPVLKLTITPSTLALVLTKYAPILKLAVTPTTLALVLATYAPVLKLSVTPSTLVLTLTTYAPTILAPMVVTPATLTLTLTAYAPTVTTGADVVVTPSTLALLLTLYAPEINITGRLLKVMVITSQHRDVTALTSQYRMIRALTTLYRRIHTITTGG